MGKTNDLARSRKTLADDDMTTEQAMPRRSMLRAIGFGGTATAMLALAGCGTISLGGGGGDPVRRDSDVTADGAKADPDRQDSD